MTTYRVIGGTHGVDAQVIGETIERLNREVGAADPRSFVDVSRPENAPTHDLFEWDDAKAAEEYRVTQARSVIRRIRIVNDETDEAQPEPAFVHVKVVSEDGVTEGYKPTSEVRATPDLHRFVLREAIEQLRGLQRRYRHLEELAPLSPVIDEIEENSLSDEEAPA
jgi:hypothetical protein